MTLGLQAPGREPSVAPRLVQAVVDLFDRLHAAGVRYCHWKSNEHLRATMAGITDIDVLVDRTAAQDLVRLLADTTFKRFETIARRSYPAIESYLGLDPDTGRLLHLHLHHRLTLGERHLKGYRLPWEETVLATRMWDEASGVYVTDPHVELILLFVRLAMQLRLRDRLFGAFGRPYVPAGALREFRWLTGRVQRASLSEIAETLVGAEAATLLVAMASDQEPTARQLHAFRQAIRPSLAMYRTYGAVAAWWLRGLRRWRVQLAKLERRLGRHVNVRRVVPHGGVLVAFVGSDGSGKSTVAAEIVRWLSPELDAVRLYFGNGKGTISLGRRLLEFGASVVHGVTGRRAASGEPARLPSFRRAAGKSWIRDWGDLLWVLALARERRRRFRDACRARNRGMIVVCDRFPQAQFPGLNDGPWLGHWLQHPSQLRRAAARRELAAIQLGEIQAPDLVVKLHVPTPIAQQRRPNVPTEQLARKASEILALEFRGAGRIVNIDASQPLNHVLLEVKRALWTIL
jgi:hypothetical protein